MKRRLFLVVVAVLFAFSFQTAEALEISDLKLKLPFPSGDVWGTSCVYNGLYDAGGIPLKGCETHGPSKTDRYALDFNHYNSSGTPDDCGKTIVSVADGVVRKIRRSINSEGFGYGWLIDIYHGGGYLSRCAHLYERPELEEGDFVFRGQAIARCGSSGTSACHLHFVFYSIGEDGKLTSVRPEPMDGYNDFSVSGQTYQSTNDTSLMCKIEQFELDSFCRDNCPHPLVERYRDKNTGKIRITSSFNDGNIWYYTSLCNVEAYPVALAEIYDGRGGDYEEGNLMDDGGGDSGDEGTVTSSVDLNIKYVQVSTPDGSKETSLQVVQGGKFDAHVKVSNKGDSRANNFEAYYYLSRDTELSSDDLYLGKDEELDLDGGADMWERKASRIAPMEVGRWYLLCKVTYSDDSNPDNNVSRADDREEYAVVEVVVPVTQPFRTPPQLTQQQKMAVLSIIEKIILGK